MACASPGSISVGEEVVATVDPERRKAISRAHSATHLLHAALRSILGDHVHQAGSLVDADYLRFDFTHFEAMTPKEVAAVEDAVNNAVLDGADITVSEMRLEDAKNSGATALFGEKIRRCCPRCQNGRFQHRSCAAARILITLPRSACSI